MDETYIRKRVSRVYSQSYGGGMIDKFTALIVELLNEYAAQQSVQADEPTRCPECNELKMWNGICHSATCPSARR